MIQRATKTDNKLTALICYCCGEIYFLRDVSKENPLEVCGECGAEYFLPFSRDCLRGYRSLEQYLSVLDILPEHLRGALPSELTPQPSPFASP